MADEVTTTPEVTTDQTDSHEEVATTIPKQQYDEVKSKLEARMKALQEEKDSLLKQFEEASTKAKTADELNAEIEKLRTESAKRDEEYTKQMESLKVNSVLDTALIKAGCVDTVATKAHIDLSKITLDGDELTGFSVEELKTSKPYLFQQTKVKDVGVPAGKGFSDEDEAIRKAMGLK